ncbi:MAG: hypothetical protein KAJ63_16600 [Methyloprofundus sp.]|nr:hypothetical protein [Methyloprofundus sp.]
MIKKYLILASLIASIGFTASAAGNTGQDCDKPIFNAFDPVNKSEVDPESEISFTVSGYADPITIKATAKNIPLKLNIVDRDSFYAVFARLPAALTGKTARINVEANNTEWCKAKDGWLLRIRDEAVGTDDIVADMLGVKTYEMINNLVTNTPFAKMTIEDFGNNTTLMTITTPSVSSLGQLLDDGILIYIQTLDGEVDINISFNGDGSTTMTITHML